MNRTGFFARALALVAAPLMPAVIAALPSAEPEVVELEPTMAMGGLPSSVPDELLEVRVAGLDGLRMTWAPIGSIPRSVAQDVLRFDHPDFTPDLDDLISSPRFTSMYPMKNFAEHMPWADRFELLTSQRSPLEGLTKVIAQGRIWAEQTPRGWDDDFMGSWLQPVLSNGGRLARTYDGSGLLRAMGPGPNFGP